jgi:membrane protein DedA with SNARE-associated domain
VEQFLTITGSLQHFLQSWGYLALFLVAVVEAACIPFPSEVTFGFAGAMVALGTSHMNLPLVIVVGVVGEIIGSIGGYYIGKYGGRALIDRYGKYVLLSHHDLDRADRFMERRGDPAVLIGRMTPLLRSFSAIVAGIGEMPFARFMVFTSIGTAVYGVALVSTGYALGSAWNKILKGFTDAGVVVAIIVVIVVAVAIAHRWRSMRADRAGSTVDSGR